MNAHEFLEEFQKNDAMHHVSWASDGWHAL